MKLQNCKECGKVFSSSGADICPDCRKSEEEKFELVKNYLWDNPNSTIVKVSEETGVEEEIIIKFMKENRLQAQGLLIDHKLNCRRCGKEIESGTFCKSCRNDMVQQFNVNKDEFEDKSKKQQEMFLKDRFKRRK